MALETGQMDITTTAVQIAPASSRAMITLTNMSTTPIFIGKTSGVTATTGQLIPGVVGASETFESPAAIYGITASGTARLSWSELT